MQRGALLDAARSLLTEGGVQALTFPALAERTGLARSSVYEYFRSRAALVEELCAVDLPLWAAEVAGAMDAAETPRAKVEAYVRTQLALASDERHRAVMAFSAGELDEAARERVRAAHGGLMDMVVDVLAELGHAEPRVVAALLQGVVDAAVRCAASPLPWSADVIADLAVHTALDGVACLPGNGLAVPGDGHAGGRQQPGGSAA